MIKKEIYPKTRRMKLEGEKFYITEKLDGSNLVFYKQNGKLHICQRKTIYTLNEISELKDIVYKGLYSWLQDNGKWLEENLNEGSAICGEWLGMGVLKYTIDEFDKRYYMFAKANIDEEGKLYNIKYNHEHFIYPFIEKEVPRFIGIVPEVAELNALNIGIMNSLYDKYKQKVGGRNVEGFVISYNDSIVKYLRMKGGKLIDHKE